jgi:dihydroneopterin aldolase
MKTAAPDTVRIVGLEVETLIGVHPWERQMRQTLRFDLELGVDATRAAAADAIEAALDYGAVAQALLEFGAASRFNLIETFAVRAAEMLHARFGVRWLRLTLHKPGALREADEVGVRIERSWG